MCRTIWLAPLAAGLLLLPAAVRADDEQEQEKQEGAAATPAAIADAALERKVETLEARLQELQDWKDEQELQALQQAAQTEAASEAAFDQLFPQHRPEPLVKKPDRTALSACPAYCTFIGGLCKVLK